MNALTNYRTQNKDLKAKNGKIQD